VTDTANVLAHDAGTKRGRIIPADFTVTSGDYVMCLGADVSGSIVATDGQVFQVAQSIDLTRLSLLSVQIKYKA
jgi:hypothetical protein